MTSKKTVVQKRTQAPRNSDKTKQFDKDWERLSATGRYDMHRLKEAMLLLTAKDDPLPAEYRPVPHDNVGENLAYGDFAIGSAFKVADHFTGWH